ncbi:hypothetical protein [Natrinema sp. 1APR25-10V2]|uniref:hypothetical protein n=1 Tax=Natrinema sp. 1APR25-10V2 TaxID=2951081 RepID=UPI002876C18C|nr:hypothetical protein [Natrinema sp. 1APR25-10V2]MDS0475525.1 hypothetical protein [Natrinema sp. 1APR25-10V2]
MKRNISDTSDGVSRRSVLTIGAVAGVGTVAGCLGGTDEGEGDAEQEASNGDHPGDVGSDVSEETRALAAEMVESIDDDLSVREWQLHSMFVPEYTDSRGVEGDVRILGDAYADIVDRGFDYRAMPTALDENMYTDFMVFLEPEWATAYLNGDWSKEVYYAEIEASHH